MTGNFLPLLLPGYSRRQRVASYPSDPEGVRVLNGTNDFFYLAHNESLSMLGGDSFTCEAWVWLDVAGNPTPRTVVSKDAGQASNSEYFLGLSFNGSIFDFVFGGPNGAPDEFVWARTSATAYGEITANKWYHLIGWFDADVPSINLLMNGTFLAEQLGSQIVVPANNTAFQLGLHPDYLADPKWPRKYLDGKLGPIRIWRRTLTADERLWLYNGGSARYYSDLRQTEGIGVGGNLLSGLISAWNLNETSGDAIDHHGDNTLTEMNTVDSEAIRPTVV